MRTALSVLLILVAYAATSAEAGDPQVGELHPEIRLPTIDGERTISLRALAGKRVLLLQFASW